MENSTTIKVELGISAQKIIQQVQLINGNVEEQVAKGIELALSDLCEGDNFIQLVRESTKIELTQIVNRAVISWDISQKIHKLVAEKISNKIEEYAEQISTQLISCLNMTENGKSN